VAAPEQPFDDRLPLGGGVCEPAHPLEQECTAVERVDVVALLLEGSLPDRERVVRAAATLEGGSLVPDQRGVVGCERQTGVDDSLRLLVVARREVGVREAPILR
jgi:hypothetical protein